MEPDDPLPWRQARHSPSGVAIEVERRSTGTHDALVVRTTDRRFGKALQELFFQGDAGEFRKSFPAGSLTTDIYERFARCADALLRQTARLEPVPWDRALEEAARRLDREGVHWWLTGSTALAIRGVDAAPRDIDLVLDETGAMVAARAFGDALIEPAVPVDGWVCRWFGRAFIGARVEWIGGVLEAADRPEPTDFGLVAQGNLEQVPWRGVNIHVPPLALQRAAAVRRGLGDRVAAIDAWGRL